MSSSALTTETVSPDSASKMQVARVKQEQKAIWDLMAEVMKPGEDYGITPGSKKPSLYKPGSEKILSMFRLSVDVVIEDVPVAMSDIGPRYTEYRVRVYVIVKEMASGRFIGKGLGEASSYEEKYLWRKAVSDREYAHYEKIHPDLVRIDFGGYYDRDTGKRVEYENKQVRVPTADRMNTVLKMCKKRAQIDATLTATAASAIFAQDLEDIKKELQAALLEDEDMDQTPEHEKRPSGPPARPQRKSKAAAAAAKPAAQNGQPEAKSKGQPEEGEPKERDKDCISAAQERMLWGLSRSCKLSQEEVKAKLKAEFKNKAGQPLDHSYDMLAKDFQRYIDSIDPEFKFHTH